VERQDLYKFVWKWTGHSLPGQRIFYASSTLNTTRFSKNSKTHTNWQSAACTWFIPIFNQLRKEGKQELLETKLWPTRLRQGSTQSEENTPRKSELNQLIVFLIAHLGVGHQSTCASVWVMSNSIPAVGVWQGRGWGSPNAGARQRRGKRGPSSSIDIDGGCGGEEEWSHRKALSWNGTPPFRRAVSLLHQVVGDRGLSTTNRQPSPDGRGRAISDREERGGCQPQRRAILSTIRSG
jgi:hypothetical protein